MKANTSSHQTRQIVWIFTLLLLLATVACGGGDKESEATASPTVLPAAASASATPTKPGATSAPVHEQEQPVERGVDGMVMVYVPAGEFLMGSDESPFPQEKPQHLVTLDGFWIDRVEVSNAQYRLCVGAGDCAESKAWTDSNLNGDEQPALVLWEAAQTYCEWVGGRLPTEAEWEKAARGTDGRTWPWGSEFQPDRANLSGDDDGYEFTAPVGSFPTGVSPYGLLDMAGNAAEWVADWYDAEAYAHSPAQNPTGPGGGDQKVIRGTIANGGGGPEKSRCIARYPQDPTRWEFGLRCVATEPPAGATEMPGVTPPADQPADQPASPESQPATPLAQQPAGAPLETASLEGLDSYRLTMTYQVGDGAGSGTQVVYTEEWVREPPARRFTMSVAEGVPPTEYVIVGDSAWIKAGGAWMTIPEADVEDVDNNLSTFLTPESDMTLMGEETVNGIPCKHYVLDIEIGSQSMHHEMWVADQGDLPAVAVRSVYRTEIKSGQTTMVTDAEVNLSDINVPITIEPPE